MKPIVKSFLVFALVLIPTVASAQGYYGPPQSPYPGGFHRRMNRLAWGFSVGLGGMHDSGGLTTCDNCDYNPIAFEVDAHLGGFITPRLALLFEAQVNGTTVSQDTGNGNGDTVLTQTALMGALQFWLTPQLWIKGGIGYTDLQANDNYSGGTYGSGVAFLGAVGFELLSTRRFALDLQGRIIEGSYSSFGDNVQSATVGLGFNWY
jgi:hypothetical protein